MSPKEIQYIRNVLRQGTIKWEGRAECLRRARKQVFVRFGKEGQPIYKLHWRCAVCKRWTKDVKTMEVDHIKEVGPFSGDWNVEIKAVFSRQNNLQAVCQVCHLKKTNKYNSARTRWSRK